MPTKVIKEKYWEEVEDFIGRLYNKPKKEVMWYFERFIEKALKAQREEILKEVLQEFDLELEAWMDVHEERQRTFQTKELLKHMRNKLCLDKLK